MCRWVVNQLLYGSIIISLGYFFFFCQNEPGGRGDLFAIPPLTRSPRINIFELLGPLENSHGACLFNGHILYFTIEEDTPGRKKVL